MLRFLVCPDAEDRSCDSEILTDAGGNSAEIAFAIVKTPDGRCRIESEDGSMWAE